MGIPAAAVLFTVFTMAAVPDQYQLLLDAEQYKLLLSQLNMALAAQPVKSTDVDRCGLLMLKGETLLRTKSFAAAEDAFKSAAAAAKADTASQASLARAMVLLIKHSSAGLYQPRTKTSGSKPSAAIDITDPRSRKDAFAAFCSDRLEITKPMVATVDAISTLPPMIVLARQAEDDRDIEVAATGGDAESKDRLNKLAARSSSIISKVTDPMAARIAVLTKDAASKQKALGRRTPAGFFSSLTTDATDELNTMVADARQASASARQMESIFGYIGDFKTIDTDAALAIAAANKLLTKYHHPAV